jgi:transcriptional regulator with XRE-family HTH domain
MQGCVAILQFAPLTFKSLIKKSFDFEPKTLGEHIKKKCLMEGLFLEQLATRLGVTESTVINWEKGHHRTALHLRPRIIEFLGYDPYPPAETVGQKMRAKRHLLGLSIKEMAHRMGVDEASWGNWEREGVILYREHRVLVAKFIGVPVEQFVHTMRVRWNTRHKKGTVNSHR